METRERERGGGEREADEKIFFHCMRERSGRMNRDCGRDIERKKRREEREAWQQKLSHHVREK